MDAMGTGKLHVWRCDLYNYATALQRLKCHGHGQDAAAAPAAACTCLQHAAKPALSAFLFASSVTTGPPG